MDLEELVGRVLDGETSPLACPTEGEWHAAWVDRELGLLEPAAMAATGGALADRLAWVFLAGYQATMARCFPQLERRRGWTSFVNTEDRTGTRPGTALTGAPGARRLSGWKTWLAAAGHVERLLVSARQNETPFAVVPRDAPGVSIEVDGPKSYLSELVQGRVELVDVAVGEADLVGDERTFPVFRASESAYIRVALSAFMFSHARRLGAPPALIGETLAGLLEAAALLELTLPSDAATVATFGAAQRTSVLASTFEAFIEQRDPTLHALWKKDERLVYGAAGRLEARAEAALARPR